MAEQSMFWPTTGTGDGTSGGYTTDRLASIWKSVIGDGVLFYLNKLSMSGATTTTLTVGTGAAVVSGYLYENTSSVTISTAALGTGTYTLYLIANESASALTVSRSASGTSVAAKTVRLALNATTPTEPYISIGEVTTVSGQISTISTNSGRYALARSQNYSVAALWEASAVSVPNLTDTTVTGSTFVSNSDFVSINTTTGVISILGTGAYLIEFQCEWDTNTTNRRRLEVNTGITPYPNFQMLASSFITATYTQQRMIAVYYPPLGTGSLTCTLWQDSGATRTTGDIRIQVVRL